MRNIRKNYASHYRLFSILNQLDYDPTAQAYPLLKVAWQVYHKPKLFELYQTEFLSAAKSAQAALDPSGLECWQLEFVALML